MCPLDSSRDQPDPCNWLIYRNFTSLAWSLQTCVGKSDLGGTLAKPESTALESVPGSWETSRSTACRQSRTTTGDLA